MSEVSGACFGHVESHDRVRCSRRVAIAMLEKRGLALRASVVSWLILSRNIQRKRVATSAVAENWTHQSQWEWSAMQLDTPPTRILVACPADPKKIFQEPLLLSGLASPLQTTSSSVNLSPLLKQRCAWCLLWLIILSCPRSAFRPVVACRPPGSTLPCPTPTRPCSR